MLFSTKLIKLLGGYTEEEYLSKIIDTNLNPIKDENFEVGDNVFFFYVSRRDYQSSAYYAAKIKGIQTTENVKGNKTYKYTLDTSDLRRVFASDFEVDSLHIAKTKKVLRDKIMNSEKYTFLTFMSYEDIEK